MQAAEREGNSNDALLLAELQVPRGEREDGKELRRFRCRVH